LVGVPTEREEDLQATLELNKEISPEILSVNYFSPIPGSDLYDYCKENDIINVTSYDMYVRGAVDNKIRGIDYQRLGLIKERIEKCSPQWYQERYFASCVLKRWKGLIKQGHFIQSAKEFITHTPILNNSIRKPYQKVTLQAT
jgi:radical SAM superfamily enzyme YgiQ (UPF0313 family)